MTEHTERLSDYFVGVIDGSKEDQNGKEFYQVLSYDKWAENYEKDIVEILGYKLHESLVDFLEDVLKNETTLNKSSTILDIAAGTGLVGIELRQRGFVGQIDGHDGSANMLEVAKKKDGVYKNLFCHMMDPHSALPDEMVSRSYDIVTACGAIRIESIPYKCIKQLVSCLKVGGILVFTIKLTPKLADFEFRFALERECFELVGQGCLELLDMRLCKNYRKAILGTEMRVAPTMYLYCYKKLKHFTN